MKYFKHLSRSLNDSLIFEAVEKFGGDGYMVYFGILEMMADEFDVHNPGVYDVSLKKVCKYLQLSRQKTVKILAFFDQKAKINHKKNIGFLVNLAGDRIIIKCPKFKALADDYTRKILNKKSG